MQYELTFEALEALKHLDQGRGIQLLMVLGISIHPTPTHIPPIYPTHDSIYSI